VFKVFAVFKLCYRRMSTEQNCKIPNTETSFKAP
jgi:hypothetical protein